MPSLSLQTPFGEMWICENNGAICKVALNKPDEEHRETALLLKAVTQMEEYFSLKRKSFDLPIEFNGTSFYNSVWRALCEIPYGETQTYGEIAAKIKRPKAARAVGMANHNNPIMIIVPCHRVIGANGALTGYAGGLHIKEYLLKLENLKQI